MLHLWIQQARDYYGNNRTVGNDIFNIDIGGNCCFFLTCQTCEWVVQARKWVIHARDWFTLHHEQIVSHLWMYAFHHRWYSCSHITHINESCHTYKWVISHLWMRRWQYAQLFRTRHIYKRGMSHIYASRVTYDTYISESCHIHKSRRRYKCMSTRFDRVTVLAAPSHMSTHFKRVMWHTWINHVALMNV